MSPTKKVFVSGLVLFLSSFTLVNALLITRVWDPLWNPFRPSPEQVLVDMVQRSKEIDTFHLVQNLRLQGTIQEQIIEANLRVISDINQSKIEQFRGSSRFLFDLSIPSDGKNLQFKLEGESVSLGDTTYLKITSLGFPPEIRALLLEKEGIDLDQFLNRWLRINYQELFAFLGSDEEMIAQQIQKQRELQKELQELLLSPQFYVVRQEFPDEKFGGATLYHYDVEIKLQELLDAVLTKVFEKQPVPGEGAPELDVLKEAIKGAVNRVLQKIAPLSLDMWIDKQTLYLGRATIAKTIDLKEFDPGFEGTLSFSFEFVYSDFNKPIQIIAPQDSIPLQELLGPIFESLRSPQPLSHLE